ncbi:MAG: Gx transporter family protein, partial [Clostridiales bacterium]|nr:Gx transporter family protein [Clostridiales bacterium]
MSAMFVAVMMVLSYIESLIPIGGVPGMKIGLANSVLLLSLYWLGIVISIQLMIVKVFLSAFMFGGFMALPYSLAGGVLSLAVMIILIYLVKGVSPVGVGVAGAVAHNAAQVGVAMLVLQTSQLVYYMAILIAVAIVTGALTGTVAKLLMYYLPKERKALFSQT